MCPPQLQSTRQRLAKPPPRDRGQRGDRGPYSGSLSNFGDRSRCFTCGASGHFPKQFPQRGKQKSSETPGRSLGSGHSSTVAQVASYNNDQGESHQKSELQWWEVGLNDALTKVTATMHGIVSEGSERNAQLGPIPIAKVKLEGSETEALLYTGSPVTIVSLQFLLEALAKQKIDDQSPDDWMHMVEKRFELSIINLQNYSGVKINIIRQMTASISRSENAEVQATVQVQKDAPAKLLIGTDLLPALSFILQME